MKDVSEITGHPECLDGRVKTLHPKVHGGNEFISTTCRFGTAAHFESVLLQQQPVASVIATRCAGGVVLALGRQEEEEVLHLGHPCD